MNRELSMVLKEIIDTIPEGLYVDLEFTLSNILESVLFAAPEVMPYWWNRVYDTLMDKLFCEGTFDRNIEWMESIRKTWINELQTG